MESPHEPQVEYSALPVGDEETLLRLIWSDVDLNDEGGLKPTAFSSQDLMERGVSVDRTCLATRLNMDALATFQKSKSRKPDGAYPYVSLVSVIALRAEQDEAGQALFIVEASPTVADPSRNLPANRAHAHFLSRAKGPRSKVNELRLILLNLFAPPTPLANHSFSS